MLHLPASYIGPSPINKNKCNLWADSVIFHLAFAQTTGITLDRKWELCEMTGYEITAVKHLKEADFLTHKALSTCTHIILHNHSRKLFHTNDCRLTCYTYLVCKQPHYKETHYNHSACSQGKDEYQWLGHSRFTFWTRDLMCICRIHICKTNISCKTFLLLNYSLKILVMYNPWN